MYSGGKASHTAVGQLRWMILHVYLEDSFFPPYFAQLLNELPV